MDAVKYLQEKARMTGSCETGCKDCPLNEYAPCNVLEVKYTKKAVEIVKKWAAEHPVKTRQSEFLRMFPNALINDGVLRIHPCDMDKEYIEQDDEKCRAYAPQKLAYGCGECCRDYWLAEVDDAWAAEH